MEIKFIYVVNSEMNVHRTCHFEMGLRSQYVCNLVGICRRAEMTVLGQ